MNLQTLINYQHKASHYVQMADKKYNEGVLTNDRQKITMKVCTQMTDKNYNETVHTNDIQKYNEGVHTNNRQKIQ